MTGVYIHDGRRPGHHTWATTAVSAGNADGVFVSPFCTPRYAVPRYADGPTFTRSVVAAGGDVVFDAMTHARLLPGANKLDLYDTWELWGDDGVGLDTPTRRQQHVSRVFGRQTELGLARLAPTQTLQVPTSPEANNALETARLASAIDSGSWQTLVGTRSFWRSGVDLDAYIGLLVELRAPVWILTVANEMVLDASPDLSDTDAYVGLLRTIHSLSERSRVIVAFADYTGLLSAAAGADSLGTGWDRAMRTFDPLSFHLDSDPGIRIPASYVTQASLHAVLRRDAANAIDRWNPAEALRIRGGALPSNDAAERTHHLASLRRALLEVTSQGTRADKVAALRGRYANAATDFNAVIGAVRPAVKASDKESWLNRHVQVLEGYASAEGL